MINFLIKNNSNKLAFIVELVVLLLYFNLAQGGIVIKFFSCDYIDDIRIVSLVLTFVLLFTGMAITYKKARA